MKFYSDDTNSLETPNYRRSDHLNKQVSGSDYRGMDMNLQSHLGRTLRRVYEPELSSELPPEMMDLLTRLDSIPSGGTKT